MSKLEQIKATSVSARKADEGPAAVNIQPATLTGGIERPVVRGSWTIHPNQPPNASSSKGVNYLNFKRPAYARALGVPDAPSTVIPPDLRPNYGDERLFISRIS
jgi:hypothetical protein